MKIQSVRGMNDIGDEQSHLWRYIEASMRRLAEAYAFVEVRTPILEPTLLFQRSLGVETDAVAKEMYTFSDRNGDSLSLRPEATASVVRAAIENSWFRKHPTLKAYYLGPMFRHERPQKGRYRQFYQFGVELLGVAGPAADIEVITLQYDILQRLGVEGAKLHISSLGCNTCRPPYREKLVNYLSAYEKDLCSDCQRRLHTNPLRILDCKVEKCKQLTSKSPLMIDYLCTACQEHFDAVRDALVATGIDFILDAKIVRGLDYYQRTAFEFIDHSNKLGSQATIIGGGRYDGLVQNLGGPATPGVGFALGIERLALLLEERLPQLQPLVDVFFVLPDSSGFHRSLPLMQKLRSKGLRVDMDLQQRGMKAQMKRANKLGARYCLILGENEIANNIAVLRNMQAQEQEEISLLRIEQELTQRFKQSINFKP